MNENVKSLIVSTAILYPSINRDYIQTSEFKIKLQFKRLKLFKRN